MSPSERPVDTKMSFPSPSKEIILKPYQEVRGRLLEFKSDARFVHIELSPGTLRFDLDSQEASICRAKIEGNEGKFVSILRVGESGNRVAVIVEDSIPAGSLDESRFGFRREPQDGHS